VIIGCQLLRDAARKRRQPPPRGRRQDLIEMASGEGDCRVKEAPDIGDEQLWVLEQ
jgi:hypothetical protein